MQQSLKHTKGLYKTIALPQLASGITIREVLNRRQMKLFIDLPYHMYKRNDCYLPQLKKDVWATFDKKKNPAFDFCEARCWLAYKNERIVGRIAGILNHAFIEKWKSRYMRFGWLEFEQDPEIATALLHTVECWAARANMTAVHGPLGFTNFDHAGLLTYGFNETGTFATMYNHDYYPAAIEDAGYEKEVDYLEFKIKLPEQMPDRLCKIAAVVQTRYGLTTLQTRSVKDILPYAAEIFSLMNDAYADLHGFVPLTPKQVAYNTRKYLSFIRHDFVSLILDKHGALAAFGITMPSLARALQKANGHLLPFGFMHILKAFRKNTLGDLALIAVRKDLQGKGVNALLMFELTKTYINNGIKYAESNPELETNTKVQSLWQYYDAVNHKRRRCYIKKLL